MQINSASNLPFLHIQQNVQPEANLKKAGHSGEDSKRTLTTLREIEGFSRGEECEPV